MRLLPQCMTNYTNVQGFDKVTVMVMVDCTREHTDSVTHDKKAGKVYQVIIYLIGCSRQR